MSAINKHLSWVDLTDFTPGVFTEPVAQKVLDGPQSAAQQMDDCMPLKQGGLRAFYKPTSVSVTGIGSIANEVPTGIGLLPGIAFRSGVGGDTAKRFLMTLNPVDNKSRLYAMDESNLATTWSQKDATYTFAAGSASARSTSFVKFVDSSGAVWLLFTLRDASSGQGTYKIAYVAGAGPPAGDGVLTKLNGATGALAVSQARILVSDGGATVPHRIYYGDVGVTTGAITTESTFLDVSPYQAGAAICAIVPTEPSDLLILKEGAPWSEIAGDISSTSTAVREIGTGHFGAWTEQMPVRTPTGICFIEPGGYIYLTDGRQFTNISLSIDRFYKVPPGNADIVSPGKMAFLGGFLFVPKGYVRDWETGAWFRVSHFANGAFFEADPRMNRVWMVNGGNNFDSWDIKPFDRLSATTVTPRYNTYTWRSMPLTPETGRETVIREVQLMVRTSATTNFTVTRTDSDGTQVVRTITGVTASSGPQMLSFLFPHSGAPYQDVTVTPATQDGVSEAPVIERIRIGFAEGHQR